MFFAPPPAHPICTLATPRCSYNTYTILYVQYTKNARTHARADTLTPYHTVLHSHSPLSLSLPSRSALCFSFLSFPFLFFPPVVLSFTPLYNALSAFHSVGCSLYLLSPLSFRRLICAPFASLSFISQSFLATCLLPRDKPNIWNLGNAGVRSEARRARTLIEKKALFVCCGVWIRLTEPKGLKGDPFFYCSSPFRQCNPCFLSLCPTASCTAQNKHEAQVKGTAIKGRLIRLRCGPGSSKLTYARPMIDKWLIPATIVVALRCVTGKMDAFAFRLPHTSPLIMILSIVVDLPTRAFLK